MRGIRRRWWIRLECYLQKHLNWTRAACILMVVIGAVVGITKILTKH